MPDVKFAPISAARLSRHEFAYLLRLQGDYNTGGECTHFASTDNGELCFAFPLVDGERLALVGQLHADPAEYHVDFPDSALEYGVPTRLAL